MMTTNEMREQKMRLRIDLEDAELRLGHLREKAAQGADAIIQIGNWLKKTPEVNIYRENLSALHGQPVALVVR